MACSGTALLLYIYYTYIVCMHMYVYKHFLTQQIKSDHSSLVCSEISVGAVQQIMQQRNNLSDVVLPINTNYTTDCSLRSQRRQLLQVGGEERGLSGWTAIMLNKAHNAEVLRSLSFHV
jgi:hypothetical protein